MYPGLKARFGVWYAGETHTNWKRFLRWVESLHPSVEKIQREKNLLANMQNDLAARMMEENPWRNG